MEDTKASLCGQQVSSLQATNSDPELKIKVGDRMKELHSAEQINKKASGSKQDTIFDTERCYCQTCDWSYRPKHALQIHLRNVHRISISLRPIPNPDLLPDMNDPNCYCRSCEKAISSRYGFGIHLKSMHNLNIPPRTSRILHPDITPDINDCNLYCKAFERKHIGRNSYKQHLKIIQNISVIKRGTIKYPHLQP